MYRVPAAVVVTVIAGDPGVAGAPTVANIHSASGISTGSGVPADVYVR